MPSIPTSTHPIFTPIGKAELLTLSEDGSEVTVQTEDGAISRWFITECDVEADLPNEEDGDDE